jgi:hypothetical protein
MVGRSTLLFGAVCIALVVAGAAAADHSVVRLVSPGTADLPAGFSGISADGNSVFFRTSEPLTPDDGDAVLDLYVRTDETVALVSTSSNGAEAAYLASSADGERVLFSSFGALVPADVDAAADIYESMNGSISLLSTGTEDVNAVFYRASADARHVFFETTESLSAADGDTFSDGYEAHDGEVTLVTAGTTALDALRHVSSDGTRVVFTTATSLDPADGDSAPDLYQTAGGGLTLLTPGTTTNVTFQFALADGNRVFFYSHESLVPGDTDGEQDVYERSAGATTLVTPGTAGEVRFRAVSADGTHVYFRTFESLLPADTDATSDLYEIAAGTLALIDGAHDNDPKAVSADGSRQLLETSAPLVAADVDATLDLYERASTRLRSYPERPGPFTVRLLSGGSAQLHAFFRGASSDLGRVIFDTSESLDPADVDGVTDRYEATGGSITLLTPGTSQEVSSTAAPPPPLSLDGTRVFFHTSESLSAEDIDSAGDLYEAVVAAVEPPGGRRPAGSPPTAPTAPTTAPTAPRERVGAGHPRDRTVCVCPSRRAILGR